MAVQANSFLSALKAELPGGFLMSPSYASIAAGRSPKLASSRKKPEVCKSQVLDLQGRRHLITPQLAGELY